MLLKRLIFFTESLHCLCIINFLIWCFFIELYFLLFSIILLNKYRTIPLIPLFVINYKLTVFIKESLKSFLYLNIILNLILIMFFRISLSSCIHIIEIIKKQVLIND
jgi:hypothetical protein